MKRTAPSTDNKILLKAAEVVVEAAHARGKDVTQPLPHIEAQELP